MQFCLGSHRRVTHAAELCSGVKATKENIFRPGAKQELQKLKVPISPSILLVFLSERRKHESNDLGRCNDQIVS